MTNNTPRRTTSLFRLEAYNEKFSDRSNGELLIIRPVKSWIFVILSLMFVIMLVGYLCIGTYTKRISAVGVLIPEGGVIRIYAPASGVVSKRFVKEGESVKKGQKLFVVSDERSFILQSRSGGDERFFSAAGNGRGVSDAVNESLEARLSMLADEREKTLDQLAKSENNIREKINQLDAESEMLTRQITLDEQRMALAKEQLSRDARLVQDHFLSQQAFQQRQDAILEVETRLISARRDAISLTRQKSDAKNDLALSPLRIAVQRAGFSQKRAVLEQEQAEATGRSNSIVVAPADGVVTAIMVDLGSPASQQPLAALLPSDSPLEANLFVPSRSVGFVQIGHKAKMRYQPYPYQKFGQYSGTVSEISLAPITSEMLPAGAPKVMAEGGLYRIVVKLDSQSVVTYGKSHLLGAGTVLEADILQDTRTLIEWVFEPIYSLKGRVAG